MRRLLPLLFLLATSAWADPTPPPPTSQSGLIAHEWGTFTTVAGAEGVALDWQPLAAESDLPRFVHSSGTKSGWRGKVRMETPVVYFYSDVERTVRAQVDFLEGEITEWFPWVNRSDSGKGVDWGAIRVIPPGSPSAADLTLKHEGSPSHYYPAREVDAAYVRSCRGKTSEVERFLFYRGVGNVSLPLQVQTFGPELALTNTGQAEISQAFVFEREGDRMRFASLGALASQRQLNVRPGRLSDATLPQVEQALYAALTATGLYPKEAKAMLATWRDHWFEDGQRVFYLVPRALTDRVLPLTLDPQPRELVRTIVARVEAITPALKAKLVGLVNDWATTRSASARQAVYAAGRFVGPALEQLVDEGVLSQELVDEISSR